MSIRWKRALALLATGLWIAFIFARSAQPADASVAESAAFHEFLVRLFPWMTDHFVRKLAHFTEYAILGALLHADFRLLGRGSVLLPFGLGVAVACFDEFVIQVHTLGRSGELRDVLLDSFGAATAISIAFLLRRREGGATHGRTEKET